MTRILRRADSPVNAMVDFRVKCTAAILSFLTAALLLLGVGGALAGYMMGVQQGERRTAEHQAAIIGALSAEWEIYRSNVKQHFEQTTGRLANALENGASQLRAEVSMYHGCGAICTAIAYQFGQELAHAGDSMRKAELPLLPEWKDALARTAGSADIEMVDRATESPSSTRDKGRTDLIFSESSARAAIALICGTIVLCFGIACFTFLRLQPAARDRDTGQIPRS